MARAVAYLHARQVRYSSSLTLLLAHFSPWLTLQLTRTCVLILSQCIHRVLKGENLLITSNERVKVTDFGFARIASRNAEDMRHMTHCGTDVRYISNLCLHLNYLRYKSVGNAENTYKDT